MRWHHIVSLAGGVISVTWIFSGPLSMNPARVLALARRGEGRR